MSSPRNTTQAAKDNPLEVAVASMGAGGLGQAVEEQEAAGTAELLNSTSLPTDTGGTDADFIALGFTFAQPDPKDPLFREATLPDGWSKAAGGLDTDPRGSYIVDERGVRRVGIFYKAAFYDRKADMHLIDPGYDLFSHGIYGNGEVEVDGRLTNAELQTTRQQCKQYIVQANQKPHIYGDRKARAERLLALLHERGIR